MGFLNPAPVTALRVRCINVFSAGLLLILIGSADLSGTSPRNTLAAQSNADASGQAADDRDVRMLEPGEPIKRKISGSEHHYYRIMLMADQYLRLVVDQRGIDVSVKLYQPDGKIVAESNRLTGAYGPETISWVIETSGSYKLDVRTVEREQIDGYYEVRLLEERVATFRDRSRIAPQNVFMQAEQLREQKTPRSLDQALAKYAEALQMWRDVEDRSGEAETLNVIGLIYHLLKRDPVNARRHFDQALQASRSLADRRGEAESLNNIARVYESLGERQAALDYYERSLQPWQDAGDKYGEAWTLYNIGRVYYFLKVAQKALYHHTRALTLWRDLGDLSREAATLNSIGEAYVLSNDYQNALSTYEQARERWQAAGNLNGEVSTLFSISKTYEVLHDKQKEDQFRTLAEQLTLRVQLARAESPEKAAKGDKNRLAEKAQQDAHDLLLKGTQEFQRMAIAKNDEAVRLFDSIGDYDREVFTLFDISSIYRLLGEKDKERKTLERALSIGVRIGRRSLQAEALQRIAGFHFVSENQPKAVDYYDRAIELWKKQGDRSSEAYLLASAAKIYNNLGDKEKALAYLERALSLYQTLGDRFREAYTLNDLAAIYDHLGEKQKALGYLKRTRDLRQQKGDRAGQAETLKEIIAVYLSMGQKREALEYYHQALAMYAEIRDGMGEASILRDLMAYWKELNQPRLAILHGKQAVNTYQEIRRNIQGLESETQKSFLKSKEDIYRELADLLISEGRLPEAQQVLDMLKEEEYFNFIRGTKTKDPSLAERAELTQREAELYRRYRELSDSATAISREYDKLLAKKERNSDETVQLNALTVKLEAANRAFREYFDQLPKALLQSDEKDRINDIQSQQKLRTTLRTLGPGAVALYTLVVKDKYRVIIFTPSSRVARQFSIKTADLNQKIMALRLALQDAKSDPLPPAKDLYQILVGPVAKDLEGANAQTLMWSLDGALRYIPIAALHDGEKYMVERYRNEIFTSSDMTFENVPLANSRGLGFGVSNSSEGFDPLPAVIEELNGIFRNEDDPNATGGSLPGKIMLNDQFTRDAMITALQSQRYRLVHIASHFKLQPGDGMSSYLVLGRGGKLTVAQIDDMPDIFTGVDLLTLSACNTAIGVGSGNGEEVHGFGEFARRQGAKAVLASLWSVADASTGLLMQKFYQFRMRDSQPVTSKAEALQEAQLTFLHKQVRASDPSEKNYSHPYFWAPFILIGNWQ